jgi:16S rRNA (cytosine967-C5)-methyltransferase
MERRTDAGRNGARERALQRLQRIEEGAYVGLVDARQRRDDPEDAREERLAEEYVAGVTRQRRWLDFLIDAFYRGRADGMETALRQILRLAIYDLLFLDTPPHAAVHEAVELAKRTIRPGAGGLVNGLLRALIRKQQSLPEPATGDAAGDLAIRFSHPTWMVRRWLARFGEEETRALLQSHNERPAHALRINTRKISIEDFHRRLDELGVAWRASDYLPDFVRVSRLQAVLHAGWLQEGICAVQDEAAAMVVRLLDPQPGETVIDLCAAPGGKSVYSALLMQDQGRVLAYDVHEGRTGLIRDSASVHGLSIIEAGTSDARALSASSNLPAADRVRLDAPCSGLGVLAKRADMRWNRSLEQLGELTSLQDELLDAAADVVPAGGLLVYSTCTTEPEENQQRVEAFLARRPEFEVESASGRVPGAVVTPDGFLATLPHVHGTDGAFGARLRRRH